MLISLFSLILYGGIHPAAAVDVTTPLTISSPGTYMLRNDILNSNVPVCIDITSSDVFFEGSGFTIDGTDRSNSIGISVFNATTTLTNVTIANLTVRDWAYGIQIREGQQGHIENVTAESNRGPGIQLQSTSYYTLLHTTLRTNTYGVYLASSHGNTLTENDFSANTHTGMYLLESHGNLITGTTANSNTNNGGYLSSSNNNTIQQTTANSNAYGMILSTSGNNTLTDTTVNSNTNTGLRLLSSNTTSVRGTMASENRYYGILLTTSPDNTLSDVTAVSNQYGVYLTGSTNTTIAGVSANSNTHSGIYLTVSSNNTLIGISANSNTNNGVYLTSSPRNTLQDSTAMSNQYGVYLIGSENTTISTMVASGNTLYGMYLATSGATTISDTIANSNVNMGIYLSSSNDCTLTSNHAISNNYGIRLVSSHRCTLTNNTASYNIYGISLSASTQNLITTSTVNNNVNSGLHLATSHENFFENTSAVNNTNVGIYLDRSNDNILLQGVSSGNTYAGIYLTSSINNVIQGANVSSNTYGIYLTSSSNSSLIGVTGFQNTNSAIYLTSSHDTTIHHSNLYENTNYGLYLRSSQRATIYNNYLNNTNNVGFGGTVYSSTWNVSKIPGTNIMNGPFLGGNFWGEPDWSGFSQVTADGDGDGICDSAYPLATGNIDYLPMHRPLPVANFTANLTSGQSPLSVSFNDTSTGSGISHWYWDFGDGNTSTSRNTVYLYEVPGIYNVSLRVTNDGGSDWENRTAFITVTNQTPVANFTAIPTSGQAPLSVQFTDTSTGDGIVQWYWDFGDGGSCTLKNTIHRYETPGSYNVHLRVTSDGGGDWENRTGYVNVSPQPAATRAYIQISGGGSPQGTISLYAGRIPGGEEYTFLAGERTPVSAIQVCPRETVTDVFLYLERIPSLPEGTPLPPSLVYGYFTIVLKGSLPGFLDHASIDFTVPRDWLVDHNIDPQTIELGAYRDDRWILLPVQSLSEQEDRALYRATTRDLSYLYAITGKEKNPIADERSLSPPDSRLPTPLPGDYEQSGLPLPYLGLITYGAVMFLVGFFCKSCLVNRSNSR